MAGKPVKGITCEALKRLGLARTALWQAWRATAPANLLKQHNP